jgi:hypothetical protein
MHLNIYRKTTTTHRKVQRAWRVKHRWDEDVSWRILFSTKEIFSIKGPKIATKYANEVSCKYNESNESSIKVKEEQGEVSNIDNNKKVGGGSGFELMPALARTLTISMTAHFRNGDLDMLPQEWKLMLDRDVKPELRDQVLDQLVQWQKCALMVMFKNTPSFMLSISYVCIGYMNICILFLFLLKYFILTPVHIYIHELLMNISRCKPDAGYYWRDCIQTVDELPWSELGAT